MVVYLLNQDRNVHRKVLHRIGLLHVELLQHLGIMVHQENLVLLFCLEQLIFYKFLEELLRKLLKPMGDKVLL